MRTSDIQPAGASADSATTSEPKATERRMPTRIQVVVSLLVAGLGLLAAKTLGLVDQDLRNMYTEYTLAATGLAHTSTDLLRYRVTISRALEAPTGQEVDRLLASLPDQRGRIMDAVQQYAVTRRTLVRGVGSGEEDLEGFKRSLDLYFMSAEKTVALLRQMAGAPPEEATRLRHEAEHHAAEQAGPKLVQASDALERLLLGVADIGKEMREDGSGVIRTTSIALVIGSLLIAALNLLA